MIDTPSQSLLPDQPPDASPVSDKVGESSEAIERNLRISDEELVEWHTRLTNIFQSNERFDDEVFKLNDLHPADVADLIESLPRDLARDLIEQIGRELQAEIWPELDAVVREDLIDVLPAKAMAQVITELDADDVVDVLEDLDEHQQNAILASLPVANRWAVQDALSYPEYSAGRLMARTVVALPKDWTVGHAIDFMRVSANLPDSFYEVFLVDAVHRPVGQLALSKILRTNRQVKMEDLVEDELLLISPTMDQEELAHQFRQYGLVSVPIVEDDSGRLIGVVTVDDVVHVIDEEAEDDLMKLVGMSSGERDVQRSVRETARNRFIWLAINLCTAIIASLVIAVFQGTIEQIVALAVLMPIVASMGGNAGTQTLAVAIRALAMKDLRSTRAVLFIRRELLVGVLNGLGFALVAGVMAWLWFQSPILGLVIAAAMLVNLVVAGLSGTVVPLALNKLGIDPANASSVFLTTITDVVGFFAFLGLAAIFLVR